MNEYEFEIFYEGRKTIYVRAKSEQEARGLVEREGMCNGWTGFDVTEEVTGHKLINWLPIEKKDDKND